MFQPLVERVKKGEGGLILFNVLLSVFFYRNLSMVVLQSLLAILSMSMLYGFNDYVDRNADLVNPKKNPTLTKRIGQHHLYFILLNLLISFGCIALAIRLVDYKKGLLVAALLVVNMVYSLRVKSLPIADLIIVGIWGSLFVSIVADVPYPLIGVVGLMTSIAHLFQAITDREVDAQNQVDTSATKFKNPIFLLLGFSALLSYSIYLLLGVLAGASAFIPALSFLWIKNVHTTWNVSRVYFGTTWLLILYVTYGGF